MPGIASAYGLILIGALAIFGGSVTRDIPMIEVGTLTSFAGAALAMILPGLHRWASRREAAKRLETYRNNAARRRGLTR